MARYIDADALIEDIQETICAKCDMCDGIKCKSCDIDDTLDFLENAPTADVVPKSEVEKIFEEIERKIISDIDLCNGLLVEFDFAEEFSQRIKGEVSALLKMQDFIDYLKKKYRDKKI